jgi:hypothetical protein
MKLCISFLQRGTHVNRRIPIARNRLEKIRKILTV